MEKILEQTAKICGLMFLTSLEVSTFIHIPYHEFLQWSYVKRLTTNARTKLVILPAQPYSIIEDRNIKYILLCKLSKHLMKLASHEVFQLLLRVMQSHAHAPTTWLLPARLLGIISICEHHSHIYIYYNVEAVDLSLSLSLSPANGFCIT